MPWGLLLALLAECVAEEYGASEMFVRDLLGKSQADVDRERELEATFANFDHDRDGALNRSESWAWYRFLDEDGEDAEVTDQHRAAFLEFDQDNDDKFSRAEVHELLQCMDKVEAMNEAADREEEGADEDSEGEDQDDEEDEEGADEDEEDEEDGEDGDEEAEEDQDGP
mmetsp:Transcript_131251/g.311283  ORF Transcript_131251/g.311283 Transcript_131251/m.311283 type:complete len:169 (-) Transcript_131251:161-667(-)